MKISISVIIVAYKSQSFIACCLNSLQNAVVKYNLEIIVIDNASDDGIEGLLQREYSNVGFIQNERNIGFGAGCNQGAQIATGDILLFLNPDTIVSHDFFKSMLHAYESIPEAGILSGTLYDGAGRLLPESARRIPTVKSALKKSLKLKSGNAQYYEPINAEKIQKIPVASGAAMMIRKEQFEMLEGFDERFFMYAEDIDLSFRSNKIGWSNYLVKSALIIHLKGESTAKEGWRYNRYFYSTMAAFVHKYKGELYSNLENNLVTISVILLSIASWIYHFISRIGVGLLDLGLGLLICFGVQFAWSYLRYGIWDYFGSTDHLGSYILYTGIWIGVMGLGGAYWRERSKIVTLKLLGFGVLISLVVYSLVPLDWRFSRVVVLFSGLIMLLLKFFKFREHRMDINGKFVYVTGQKMKYGSINIDEIIGIDGKVENIKYANLPTLKTEKDMTILMNTDDSYDPVDLVMQFGDKTKYGFVSEKTRQVVYSHFSNVRGERFNHLSHHNLGKRTFIFQKRIVDLTCCVILFFPLLVYQLINLRSVRLQYWLDVFYGRKTIVGNGEGPHDSEYIDLPSCLIYCYSDTDNAITRQEKIEHYSLHYSIFDDSYYILLNWSNLCNKFTYGRIEK